MNNLQLIKPTDGQQSWGTAINNNFSHLFNQYRAILIELQGITKRIEELDTLKVKQDEFICLQRTSGTETVDGTSYYEADAFIADAFLTDDDQWDELNDLFDYNNPDYLGYDAWFVQTQNDAPLFYEGFIWNSGDLLIIHKQATSASALNQQNVSIEQWKNIMGGYYIPSGNITYNPQNKTFTTTYTKIPSMSTTISTEVVSPVLYWKPYEYNVNTGKLIYHLYCNNNGIEEDTNITKDVSITYVTKGGGNYGSLSSSKNDIIVEDLFDNTDTDDYEGIGFDIHFSNASGDHIYLPYSYKKEGKNLVISIDPFNRPTSLNYRLNIFNKIKEA